MSWEKDTTGFIVGAQRLSTLAQKATLEESNGDLQAAPAAAPSAAISVTDGQNLPVYFTGSQIDSYHSPYAAGPARTANLIGPPVFSKETSEVIASIKAKGVSGLTHGSSEWETAKQAVRAEMDLKNTNGVPTIGNPTAARTGGRRGRGPRRRGGSPTIHDTIVLDPTGSRLQNTPQTPSTPTVHRGRGRGGRPRGSRGSRGLLRGGAKRKRGRESEDDGTMSTSSEEITNMPTQSRSGRRIIQATQSTPVVKIDVDEEPQTPVIISRPPPSSKPGILKKITKRTPGASAVCKNCTRGHSPASNAIVFCDGCNTPWHQYCHDPPIKNDYLIYVDKDWFCADCIILREEKVKLQGKVPGDGMSLADKRKYLQTLSHNTLVSLLIHATSIHPSLPFYPPRATYVIPSSLAAPANSTTNPVATARLEEDEYYSEDELPYPKAGNGIQLPPESEDLALLVDDDAEVYSHRWEGIAEMLAEVARLGVSSPNKNSLGVRTGNSGFGVRVGA